MCIRDRDIRLGAKVTGVTRKKSGVELAYVDAADAASKLEVDRVIVCIGRRPFTNELLADKTGVELDERGFIKVDEHCRTGAENVWAVGDCVRGPMLAHKAKEEGVMVADLIAGLYGEINYNLVPSVIYTAPEIAWVVVARPANTTSSTTCTLSSHEQGAPSFSTPARITSTMSPPRDGCLARFSRKPCR